jgi:hypothetical protein
VVRLIAGRLDISKASEKCGEIFYSKIPIQSIFKLDESFFL